MKFLRQPTLNTLGIESTLGFFKNGRLPYTAESLVDSIFGPAGNRGSLVISGANGIVGAGKAMQLGSRLAPYGVTIVGLDFPGAADGIGRQYPGLQRAFGEEGANRIMSNFVRLSYDGKALPAALKQFNPKFLLEAIPEILPVKRAHYELFRRSFPEIEIRSVTSGFPSSELGVGVAHPSFPHEINKVWETIEEKPTDITRLLWALGMVPVPTTDNWSFILDVLFCGVTLAASRYHNATNMPYWKIDKYVRRLLGPNPFRAHDAIGAKGANFLTWSCLHHLAKQYGELFEPTPDLDERMATGQDWYPLNHFRPLVNWSMAAEEEKEFNVWMLGAILQMSSLLLHEKRGHLSHINAMGELCAQFRRGVLSWIRELGADESRRIVEAYHKLHPEAAKSCWYPESFSALESVEGQQLYVNAEHDGNVGVITIGRESYNSDVDAELNRAIDWLAAQGIRRVILTGDFHLATQLVGADTSDFFPALENRDRGFEISRNWSRTARRLDSDFETSVGFIGGKRCLGGFLELMMHCHYVVAAEDAQVGMPEVTLPVIPGMEGCHWAFRKTDASHWPKLIQLLMSGTMISASQAQGWLLDYAGSLEESLSVAWKLVMGEAGGIPRRQTERNALTIPVQTNGAGANAGVSDDARRAMMETVRKSCACTIEEAIDVQAKMSADFMSSELCRRGKIGQEFGKVMSV
ncbi:hypothetical protein IT157_04980 [bacterium]|nr:hypothetical protein [bacterium]